MPSIRERLQEKRPSLSASSLTTYTSILRSLHRQVFKGEEEDPASFEQTNKVMKHLENLPPNRRKTILSALVVIADNNTEYRAQMLEDIRAYNVEISRQERSEAQAENWVSQDEARQRWLELKANAALLYKKASPTMADLQHIQDFVLLSLFVLMPPRRSLDWCEFKLKNVDKDKHNYFVASKREAHFNVYKTAKFHGEQRVEVSKELATILNKWVKTNPTDWLLFDFNGKPLNPSKLTQRLNRIFGKKAAVNMMRHSFLTDKYGAMMEQQREMAEDMQDMGTSMRQAETYVKLT